MQGTIKRYELAPCHAQFNFNKTPGTIWEFDVVLWIDVRFDKYRKQYRLYVTQYKEQ